MYQEAGMECVLFGRIFHSLRKKGVFFLSNCKRIDAQHLEWRVKLWYMYRKMSGNRYFMINWTAEFVYSLLLWLCIVIIPSELPSTKKKDKIFFFQSRYVNNQEVIFMAKVVFLTEHADSSAAASIAHDVTLSIDRIMQTIPCTSCLHMIRSCLNRGA